MIFLCLLALPFFDAVHSVAVKASQLPALQSVLTSAGCTLAECGSVATACPTSYITCASDGSVTSILLFNVGLTGSIHSAIGVLSALTALSLARNALVGSVPSTVGQLTALVSLELNDNANLVGTLPTQLLALTALTSLNARGCRLSGALPSLGSLPKLSNCVLGYAFLLSQNCFQAPCPAVCQCLDAVEPDCVPITLAPTPVPPTPAPPTPYPTPAATPAPIATTVQPNATANTGNSTSSGSVAGTTGSGTTAGATACFGELRPGRCAAVCAPPATGFYRETGATDGTCGVDACCVPPPANCTTDGGDAGACLSRAECALHGGQPSPLAACVVDGQFMVQCCVNRTSIPTFSGPATATTSLVVDATSAAPTADAADRPHRAAASALLLSLLTTRF